MEDTEIMPTVRNTKLPPLPSSAVTPLKAVQTKKQFRQGYQEPSTAPNLIDHTAKLISLRGRKNAKPSSR
jgi:hypothetical protein